MVQECGTAVSVLPTLADPLIEGVGARSTPRAMRAPVEVSIVCVVSGAVPLTRTLITRPTMPAVGWKRLVVAPLIATPLLSHW